MWAGFHWVLVGWGVGGTVAGAPFIIACGHLWALLVGACGWLRAFFMSACGRLWALVGACGRQCCAVAGARSGPYGRLHYWGSNLLFMGVEHVYLTLSGLAKKCNQSCRLQLT